MDEDVTFSAYYLRRVKKLFPAIIMSTFITCMLQLIYKRFTGSIMQYPNEYFDVNHLLMNMIGIQSGIVGTEFSFNGPLWFISVLLLCYLIYYFIVYLCRDNKEIIVEIYIFLVIIGLALLYANPALPILNDQVATGLSCFYIGCIIYRLYKSQDEIIAARIAYFMLVLLGIVAVLSAIYGYTIIGDLRLYVTICMGPSVLCIAIYVPIFRKLLENLNWLGKISYPVYVWHFPIQILWVFLRLKFNIHFNQRKIWILYVLSVIIFSMVYNKLVEIVHNRDKSR